jgi:hypothetical protein
MKYRLKQNNPLKTQLNRLYKKDIRKMRNELFIYKYYVSSYTGHSVSSKSIIFI